MRADRPLRALVALALALACLPSWQPRAQGLLPSLGAQGDLPIELDASSSEFDRQANRLVFHGMHVTQGTLSIRADRAETERIDFENTRWTFRGNVRIVNQGTRIWCSEAELIFVGHQLQSALLRGGPARFEQPQPGRGLAEGRARNMDYAVGPGLIHLLGDAWLSDGANEIAGERITYDLGRQHVIAEGGSGGRVRMKINPAQRDEPGGSVP